MVLLEKNLVSKWEVNGEKIINRIWAKLKNLWRRKCVRRAIFQNVEVRVKGRFVPFNPYFLCNTAIGSLCDPYGVMLPKKLT